MKGRDVLFVGVLCFILGLMSGLNINIEVKNSRKNKEIERLIQQREQYYLLLEESKKKKEKLQAKVDSLNLVKGKIIERINRYPVFVYKDYDSLGNERLQALMLEEFAKYGTNIAK